MVLQNGDMTLVQSQSAKKHTHKKKTNPSISIKQPLSQTLGPLFLAHLDVGNHSKSLLSPIHKCLKFTSQKTRTEFMLSMCRPGHLSFGGVPNLQKRHPTSVYGRNPALVDMKNLSLDFSTINSIIPVISEGICLDLSGSGKW